MSNQQDKTGHQMYTTFPRGGSMPASRMSRARSVASTPGGGSGGSLTTIENQIKTLLARYAKEGHAKLRTLVSRLLASPDGYSTGLSREGFIEQVCGLGIQMTGEQAERLFEFLADAKGRVNFNRFAASYLPKVPTQHATLTPTLP